MSVLVLAAAAFAVLEFSHAGSPPPAAAGGSWSSGDRLADAHHLSSGWKKIDSLPPGGFTGVSRSWSPAIASADNRTVVLWGPSQAAPLVGFQWFKTHGTWLKNGTFFTKPLPFDSIKSAPALVHRKDKLLDVVVLGKDQYYHAFHLEKWSDWEGLGLPNGLVGGSPAITVSKLGPTTIDVWVIAGGTLFRKRWQQATSWQSWIPIGFPAGVFLTGAPGATTRADNTIDIVAAGQSDGQLFHAHFNPAGDFAGWESIPGKSFTQPSVISRAPDNLEVWVRGATDGRIFHQVWSPATGWQPFDLTINDVPNGPQQSFASGPAANVSSGVTSVVAINEQGEVLMRSSMDEVAAQPSATPLSITIRRPRHAPGDFVKDGCAENTLVISPKCERVFLSLGCTGRLQRQNTPCILNGTNQVIESSFKTCGSVLSKDVTGSKSTDNYVNVLKNGKLLLLRQVGGVSTFTSRTDSPGSCRGVEHIYFGSSCGNNWEGPIVLDPCDPNGPFDASFCNNDDNNRAVAAGVPTTLTCPQIPSGTDRPQVFASRIDGSVFIALGVAGATTTGADGTAKQKYNLVLMRSDQSNLFSWKAMDTGMESRGAAALAETLTHLYLARCEYSNPSNVGLYAYRKTDEFTAKKLIFIGNISTPNCVSGNVVMSLMRSPSGYPVVRWVIPSTDSSGNQIIKRGFSALTPGGLITLQSDELSSGKMIGLPTLIARDFKDRALLYWYELGSDDKWRVRGATSDGIGRWSAPFAISGASWSKPHLPWTLTTLPTPPHDYMTGAMFEQGNSTKFLAQWIQPVGGNNEIFYGIVNW